MTAWRNTSLSTDTERRDDGCACDASPTSTSSHTSRARRATTAARGAAAETLRLIILTCHPDRYERLPAKRSNMRAPES